MNYFFSIFILTIIITRVVIFLYPIPSPTIKKCRIHHYMYGILGIIIGLLINSIVLYAIGLGLFVDELTFILKRGKTHKDNYSKISIIGTLMFIIIVFLLRSYLVLPFTQ